MSKVFWIALALLAAFVGLSVAFRTGLPGVTPIGSVEGDAQVLQALREAGADLTKETEVNFYLYFPTRDSAVRAAESHHTPGFTATVDQGADGKTWLCRISGTMVPSEAAIRSAGERLQALASSLGGEYDGWEAAVTK